MSLNEILPKIAFQSINIVKEIAEQADKTLKEDHIILGVIGSNSFTDTTNAEDNLLRASNFVKNHASILRERPSFMRIDATAIENEDEHISFYVAEAPPPFHALSHWEESGIQFMSYNAPLGAIASYLCGDTFIFNGKEYFITKKFQFSPTDRTGDWDCLDVNVDQENKKRVFLKSLREFFQDGNEVLSVNVEEILREIEEFANTNEGRLQEMTRNVRSTMEFRSQAVLDKIQDEIFRLPIDSQLIILGPPGTGKTTTLIKRLRQKLDDSDSSFTDRELQYLTNHNKKGQGFNNWLMFTPSKLLQQYLISGFNRENVPINRNVVTWSDHARNISRQNLNLLASHGRSGLRLDDKNEVVKPKFIDDPRSWYDAFQSFFTKELDKELRTGLNNLEKAASNQHQELVNKIRAIVKSEQSIFEKYKNLFSLEQDIKDLIAEEKKVSDQIFVDERNLLLNRNPSIIDDLARYLAEQQFDDDDEDTENQYDDEDTEVESKSSYSEKKEALDTYGRFIKLYARYKFLGKSLAKNSANAHLRDWLNNKLPSDDRLKKLGKSIALQNGLRHNVNCWRRAYKKVTSIYKKFRTNKTATKYYELINDKQKLSQAELELVLLTSLRNIKYLLNERYIAQNIEETRFQELQGFGEDLFKDQILVDEATDFSVLQLACMEALSNPKLSSFFACGDFNQRLTNQGIKDISLLEWISPKLKTMRINTIYRQSPKLNDFAHSILDLMEGGDKDARSELSLNISYKGLPPVLLENQGSIEELSDWITKRILEIESIVNHNHQGEKLLPSTIVLVPNEESVREITSVLNDFLEEYNLKAVACIDGQVIGEAHDVRVCNIAYIKGLEFESAFFVGVDQLLKENPDLFYKFLYVGSTRAANYLGITCEDKLPEEMEVLRHHFGSSWKFDGLIF
ncbi:hypothetical protein AAEX37_01398 [Oligella sp. MSHR50489EDL]|uniref:hypothetical protein n=1 Tax=Oligella sp. MSHR50489EDL TaxID=3139409 RepID=UPI003D81B90D